MIRRPPGSTLFPSTTLFRSTNWPSLLRRTAVTFSTMRLHGFDNLLVAGSGATGKRSSGATTGSVVNGTTTTLRSEEHTSELQSRQYLVCRLLLEKKILDFLQ